MKILIQFGNKGYNLIDHLLTPITHVQNVDKVMLVCRHRSPEIPKVEYHSTPHLLAGFAPLAIIYEFFNLLCLGVFKRPTCVAGYLICPHGLMAFIVAKLTRRPVIISLVAGPVELYATGSPLGVDYTKPLSPLGKIFLRILKHSDAITTTGTFTKDFLVKQGIKPNRIYPIINPANETKFHPVSLPKICDVISVARLSRIKHIEVLLRAAARVKDRYPDVKVCIVGDGPLKEELKKLAMSLGIENNVDFVGFQKDIARYYNSSRIFVHTSEREGFPNAYLEASMCGLPGVVSNCGDITDIAQDGYNCFVIPAYKDHEAFAGAIIKLMDDENLYQIMSKNALERMKKISLEEITATWERIFSKCVR